MNIQDAARYVGRSEKTLRRWIHRGILPAIAIEGRYDIAENDLDALRQSEMEEALTPSEQRLEALESRINAIESLVSDREALQRIEASENNMRDLLSQMERVERLLLEHIASHTPAPQLKVLRPAPAPYDASGALPDGLVALRDFYTMHHVPETTAKRAATTGALPTVQGRWKRGRTFITHALDASGRAAFYQHYHAEPYFQRCDDCPHDVPPSH